MGFLLMNKIRILLQTVSTILLICLYYSAISANTGSSLGQTPPNMKNSDSKILRTNKLTMVDGLSIGEVQVTTQDLKGYIWIGTPVGLNRYDGTSIKKYINNPNDRWSLSTNFINDLIVDYQGRLWIATNLGLHRYNESDDSFIAYKQDKKKAGSINSNSIISLFEDSKQQLWIGTSAGINVFNSKKHIFTSYQHDKDNPLNSLQPGSVKTIFEDNQGMIWIGTISDSNSSHRGVTRLDPESGNFTRYAHDPDDDTSLQQGSVTSIFSTMDNRIWVVTNGGGLSEYLPYSKKFRRIPTIPAQPNELNATANLTKNLTGALVDRRGNVWLITSGGGLLLFDPANDSFIQYTNNIKNPTGLASNEYLSIFEDRDGLIWLGTLNNGLDILDYRKQLFNYSKGTEIEVENQPAPLFITELKLNDQKVRLSNISVINIPHDNSLLQLKFQALDYAAPELVNYQIKLEGFDGEWLNLENTNSVTYENLKPGEYTFRVKATNQYGITSREIKLDLVKQGHLFLSALTFTYYTELLIVIMMVYFLYRQRQLTVQKDTATQDKKLKLSREHRLLSAHLQNAREEERTSVAKELHDGLEQMLVQLKREMSWIQSTLERQDLVKVISKMPEVNKIIDDCVSSVKNVDTKFCSSILDDMGLIPALDWYSASICKRVGINRSFTTNCETLLLTNELSINIYRIIHEAVTNVIKHADVTKLKISCNLEGEKLHLNVQDDGIAFKASEMEKSGYYGLKSIREQVANYNGTVMISANKPSGMIIDVIIPIANDIQESDVDLEPREKK